jgi:hypothetical protein
MNGRFQMQGGKNWFLPKEMNANRFFWDSHWLEIWSNHFYPSRGPNGGSVAMDSEHIYFIFRTKLEHPLKREGNNSDHCYHFNRHRNYPKTTFFKSTKSLQSYNIIMQ